MHVIGFDGKAFHWGRLLFSLCILADAAWYIGSFETRSKYFRYLGFPIYFIYIISALYAFFGLRILLKKNLEQSSLGMIITYFVVVFLIHHPVGDGGIGDYPRTMNGEINFLQALCYQGIVSGLLLITGMEDVKRRNKIMEGSQSYAVVLGRAIFALHYIVGVIYFKFYQYRSRSQQIAIMGGYPFIHIFLVGGFHLVSSYFTWLGNRKQRKMSTLLLLCAILLLAVIDSSTMATSLGIYHMKTEARIHQFITQIQLAATALMLYATAGLESHEYVKSSQD